MLLLVIELFNCFVRYFGLWLILSDWVNLLLNNNNVGLVVWVGIFLIVNSLLILVYLVCSFIIVFIV